MLYGVFNSLKEAHGVGYFTSRIDDEEYGVNDKEVNKEFYGK